MTSKFAGQDVAAWVGIGGGAAATGGAARPAPSGGGKGTVAPAHKTQTKASEDVVRTMQDYMRALAEELNKPAVAEEIAEKYSAKIPGQDAKSKATYITGQAVQFSRTAMSRAGSAPNDGIWGGNTKTALLAIKRFVATLGIPDVLISEGEGPAPVHTMEDSKLVEEARANIINISKMFTALNISPNVGGGPGAEGMTILDKVPSTLPNAAMNTPFNWDGGISVLKDDLSNFYKFFLFSQKLNPPWSCKGGKTAGYEEYMEKLAKEILDRTIIRLSQDAEATPPPAPPAEQAPTSGGHCLKVLDGIINWFVQRARTMYVELNKALGSASKNPRPDRQGRMTKADLDLGSYYTNSMEAIKGDWDKLKDKLAKLIKNDEDPITVELLRKANGSEKEHGYGRQSGEGGAGESGTTLRNLRPPLDGRMDLSQFQNINKEQVDDIIRLSNDGEFPFLDYINFKRMGWARLAETEVKGATSRERYGNFVLWAQAISRLISSIYNEWMRQYRRSYRLWLSNQHSDTAGQAMENQFERDISTQDYWKQAWQSLLSSLITQAQEEGPRMPRRE